MRCYDHLQQESIHEGNITDIAFYIAAHGLKLQQNLYIKTTLRTNKMWSLYTGGLYMQVQ